jgi:hypothetical protein
VRLEQTHCQPFDKEPAVISQSDDVFATAPAAATRHQLRLDRQARVGILRNLNEPPRLPPRKASLTGRWLDLRSRRRLRRQGIELGQIEAPSETPCATGRELGPGQCSVSGPQGAGTGFDEVAQKWMTATDAELPGRANGPRFVAGVLVGLVVAVLCAIAASLALAPRM